VTNRLPTGRLPFAAVGRPGATLPLRQRPNCRIAALLATTGAPAFTVLLAIGAGVTPACAIDAVWTGPGTEWTVGTNWTPQTIPDNTAIFTNNGAPALLTISSPASINTIQIDAGTAGFGFTNTATANLAFAILGAGIVNNSNSSPDFTNNGFINFFNSSAAGNSTITNNGGLTFHDASTADHATIQNFLSLFFLNTSTAGTSFVHNNTFSTLFFNNSSTAGNATIINDGALQFAAASTAGNANITNNSGAFVSMTFFDTATAGNASITNNGFLGFNDTSTAGTATIDNGANSTVLFNNASTAGNATISNGNFAAGVFFSGNSTAGNASIVNGVAFAHATFFDAATAGTATIVNNHVTASTGFFNTSSAANAVIVNNVGDLEFFDASTAGNATITTNSGGRTFVSDSASGGTARFILNGTGFLDISGLTTSGTTAGSIEGGGNVFLGAKNLTVGGNNLSTTFAGVIQDGGSPGGTGGSLTKAGSGTLTLSGIDTYTGATTVNGGTLAVNGSIASSVLTTVNAGGTLAGNGIVGNTLINGGALAPGNSIGLLTVQGSLVFTAASSYMIEVSPSAADRTNVTGTATLGGATVNASFAAGTFVAKQYTILNAAGGVSGTFAGPVNTNLPANFKTSLSYDANNAYLNLLLSFIPPPSGGLNQNQQNVANAITGFFNANGGIPLVFGGLTPAGLTQASGEVATGSQQTTFDAMNLFMGVMTDPFIGCRSDPVARSTGAPQFAEENASCGNARIRSGRDAYAAIYRKAAVAPVIVDPFVQRWSVWAAGYGGSQTTDGNATLGSNTATSHIAGGVVGADYRFSPFTLAGFALAGGGTNFSIANGLGSGRSDLFQAGAFVRHAVGPAYLSAALAYGWQDITTDRTVTIAGLDQLRAQFNANAWSGRVEGGYRFATPWTGITPYAAGQFTTFDLPAYAETAVSGANTFALGYAAKDVTASRSELGLRTDNSWAMQNAILTLRGRFAWAHDFNTDRNVGATFQTLPGASFVVNGAARAHDAALTTASAEMKWINGWSAAATFEGEFSNVTRSYAGKGVARYQW
jgi:autotransporter-associated beta strand protein